MFYSSKNSTLSSEAAVFDALKLTLENSCEALALVEYSGEITFKNKHFNIKTCNQPLLLNKLDLSTEQIIQHQNQILKLSPISKNLLLVKQLTPPLFNQLMKPIQLLNQKLSQNQPLFPTIIETIENILPNNLIVLLKHAPNKQRFSIASARFKAKSLNLPAIQENILSLKSEHCFINDLKQTIPEVYQQLPEVLKRSQTQGLFMPYKDKEQQNLGFIAIFDSELDIDMLLPLLDSFTKEIEFQLESSDKNSLPQPIKGKEKEQLTGLPTEAAFNQALTQAEKRGKDKLLVLVKIIMPLEYEQTEKVKSILQIISQLLASFWRAGDKLFYLGGNEFAILYNNVPDMGLINLRLGSMDNVIHYKGYKDVRMKIAYKTLVEANMQGSLLYQQAKSQLD